MPNRCVPGQTETTGLELTDPQQNETTRRGTVALGGNERPGLSLSVSNVRSAGTFLPA